jgi:hypothetical protein
MFEFIWSHLQCINSVYKFMDLYSFEFYVNCETTFCGSRQRKILSYGSITLLTISIVRTYNFCLVGTAKPCFIVLAISLHCRGP